MSEYSSLANHYDTLTGNVDYEHIHRFYNEIFEKLSHSPKILLDLACGTGSLSFLFEKDGIDVIGTDSSEDMLFVAMDKKYELASNVLFLNQKASKLDLYGTVDTAVCNLDAVNHFPPQEIDEIIRRVALFLEPNGIFVFDVNSQYKFENLLNGNCYSYDENDVFCSWTSTFENKKAQIHLDIFEKISDNTYSRSEQSIDEYYYSDEELMQMLDNHGLDILFKTADFTLLPPDDKSQRIHYIVRKRENNE